ncbi:thiosulfate oxidation carrier complex protein SoxZ [uncultured Thiohalocapsa sp.]|mgnify:CR=1 FL=1|uniref:thiosulfate oxidation carrier complex protein SoxZ n=1 Tax=uncultured Thiohalocapsa sp. TaxID=768990 RepID=UPI0025D01E9C|nr:thiosulfate oxidation carrier complex protein SoxZ [uncultured Thiohalocapsa sp.]
MTERIRIRSRRREGGVDVMVLMLHPMESGLRTDADGRRIPAHYITDATVTVNEQTVLEAQLGIAVARDPLLQFRLEAAPAGAQVHVRWRDNRGERQMATATLA